MADGDYSLDELFASIERGIYCKQMGGGSGGATGEFNFAVSEAYLIENGNLTKPYQLELLFLTCKFSATSMS